MSPSDDPEFVGVSVATPTLCYVWPKRADFELLQPEEIVFEWKPCKATTLIKKDGLQWERRIRSKWVQQGDVKVVFQLFDERPVEAQREQAAA